MTCIIGGVAGYAGVEILAALGLDPGQSVLIFLAIGLLVLTVNVIRGFLQGVLEAREEQEKAVSACSDRRDRGEVS